MTKATQDQRSLANKTGLVVKVKGLKVVQGMQHCLEANNTRSVYRLVVALGIASMMSIGSRCWGQQASTTHAPVIQKSEAGGGRGATDAPARIYLGLMDAGFSWNLIRTSENIVRYSWRSEENGGATSNREFVGISPLGYLEGGKYFQLTPRAVDFHQRTAECDSLLDIKLVGKCYSNFGNELFPDLAPITSSTWFYRGVPRTVRAGAVPARATQADFSGALHPAVQWRSFLFMTHPFFLAKHNDGQLNTVGFRKSYPPWVGDVVSTSNKVSTYALRPVTDLDVERQVGDVATRTWLPTLELFRESRLRQIASPKREQYEKNLGLAVEFLKTGNPRKSPFARVTTPEGGKYANKLFAVVWSSDVADLWFDPADIVGLSGVAFKFTAVVFRDPSGYRVLRSGFGINDEIQFLQTVIGSILESPQADFYIYTDSGIHSPSQKIIRPTQGLYWPEQAIDRITADGKLTRIGFMQGPYDPRYDRPIDK